MFATLLGALPRPPLPADASLEALLEAVVRVQEAAGIDPVTDGGLLRDHDPVTAWLATSRLTDRSVKHVVTGPYTLGMDGAAARAAGRGSMRASASGSAGFRIGCSWPVRSPSTLYSLRPMNSATSARMTIAVNDDSVRTSLLRTT